MLALDAAAVMSNLRLSEIEEWINSVDLHRSQAADGMQWICVNSLLWAVATKKK